MKKDPNDNHQHLSKFFEVYKNRLRPPQASIEKRMVECIREVTGIELQPNQIHYSVPTKTITLAIPSILKTEIKAQEEQILAHFKKVVTNRDAPVYIR